MIRSIFGDPSGVRHFSPKKPNPAILRRMENSMIEASNQGIYWRIFKLGDLLTPRQGAGAAQYFREKGYKALHVYRTEKGGDNEGPVTISSSCTCFCIPMRLRAIRHLLYVELDYTLPFLPDLYSLRHQMRITILALQILETLKDKPFDTKIPMGLLNLRPEELEELNYVTSIKGVVLKLEDGSCKPSEEGIELDWQLNFVGSKIAKIDIERIRKEWMSTLQERESQASALFATLQTQVRQS